MFAKGPGRRPARRPAQNSDADGHLDACNDRFRLILEAAGPMAQTPSGFRRLSVNMTDMETCYKRVRADTLKQIPLKSQRFGFEPEPATRLERTQTKCSV